MDNFNNKYNKLKGKIYISFEDIEELFTIWSKENNVEYYYNIFTDSYYFKKYSNNDLKYTCKQLSISKYTLRNLRTSEFTYVLDVISKKIF